MRVLLAVAATTLLTACVAADHEGDEGTGCSMTLVGEGADPGLRCSVSYALSPSGDDGSPVSGWVLGIEGYRDAEAEPAVVATVVFDVGFEPAAGATYACDPGSDPKAPWRASAGRFTSGSVLTHAAFSPRDFIGGLGSLSFALSSATASSTPDAATHGTLDATLFASDGTGKPLALHVEF